MGGSAGVILGGDGDSQWKAAGSDWARFWSNPNNDTSPQNAYPYVLELNLSHKIKKQFKSLAGLSTGILVTQSYADLYKCIKTGLSLDSFQDDGMKSDPLRNGVIITGQPGTGTLPTCQSMCSCSLLGR
jgi:hypothetical protein